MARIEQERLPVQGEPVCAVLECGRRHGRRVPEADRAGWTGLPASFQQGIDAALWRESNGKIYFFKGSQYVRFSNVGDGVDAGYPKPIAGNWNGLPASFTSGIDAALMREDNHKIYFFKGRRYVRYSDADNTMDAGYPATSTPTGCRSRSDRVGQASACQS